LPSVFADRRTVWIAAAVGSMAAGPAGTTMRWSRRRQDHVTDQIEHGAAGRPLCERLSVVLLTYNCAHRIDEILRRLTELRLPLVVVDNASADGTPNVVEAAGVRVIQLSRNIGAAARNVGVGWVSTPYVAFCDDDGWYERAGLAEVCDLFDAHPALAIVNTRILVDERFVDPLSDRDGRQSVVGHRWRAGLSDHGLHGRRVHSPGERLRKRRRLPRTVLHGRRGGNPGLRPDHGRLADAITCPRPPFIIAPAWPT
jgi:glycosyltransferase involved in cell wall biosynthesis